MRADARETDDDARRDPIDDPVAPRFEENPMHAFAARVTRFLTSEDGPTAVEYAVMLALIIVACITIVTSLGSNVSSTFNTVNTTGFGS
jgi:pilus assembly protein Flp/PilA